MIDQVMLLNTQIAKARELLDKIKTREMKKYNEWMKVEAMYEYVQFLKSEPLTEDNAALKEELADLERWGAMPY